MVGPWEALVAFQQMIVLADKDGIVDMTADAISRETTIPLKIITKGIEALEQPDPESRSPDEEGRRIVLLSEGRSWGWKIVNYDYYRKLRNEEERREYHRQYYRENRSKSATKKNSTAPQQNSTDSTNSSKQNAVSRKEEEHIPDGLNQSAWNDYTAHRKELRAKRLTPRGEQLAMEKLAKLPHDDQRTVVDTTISNGWTGLFPEKPNGKAKSDNSFATRLKRTRQRAGLDSC